MVCVGDNRSPRPRAGLECVSSAPSGGYLPCKGDNRQPHYAPGRGLIPPAPPPSGLRWLLGGDSAVCTPPPCKALFRGLHAPSVPSARLAAGCTPRAAVPLWRSPFDPSGPFRVTLRTAHATGQHRAQRRSAPARSRCAGAAPWACPFTTSDSENAQIQQTCGLQRVRRLKGYCRDAAPAAGVNSQQVSLPPRPPPPKAKATPTPCGQHPPVHKLCLGSACLTTAKPDLAHRKLPTGVKHQLHHPAGW